MPIPTDIDLPEGKHLLYLYNPDCDCDLIFLNIMQSPSRFYLLIENYLPPPVDPALYPDPDNPAPEPLLWCDGYTQKLYDAMLPYTQFLMQFYEYAFDPFYDATKDYYYINIYNQQGNQGTPPRIFYNQEYGTTRAERVELFRTHICYRYTNFVLLPVLDRIERPEPLDNFDSLWADMRLESDMLVDGEWLEFEWDELVVDKNDLTKVAEWKEQSPLVTVTFLQGMYRPYVYTYTVGIMKQTFHTEKFIAEYHLKSSTADEDTYVKRYRWKVKNRLSAHQSQHLWGRDVAMASVVVNCANDNIREAIEKQIPEDLLYAKVEQNNYPNAPSKIKDDLCEETFAKYYRHDEDNMKKAPYYDLRPNVPQSEKIGYGDFYIDKQGFIIWHYPIEPTLVDYQIPTSDDVFDGDAVILPHFAHTDSYYYEFPVGSGDYRTKSIGHGCITLIEKEFYIGFQPLDYTISNEYSHIIRITRRQSASGTTLYPSDGGGGGILWGPPGGGSYVPTTGDYDDGLRTWGAVMVSFDQETDSSLSSYSVRYFEGIRMYSIEIDRTGNTDYHWSYSNAKLYNYDDDAYPTFNSAGGEWHYIEGFVEGAFVPRSVYIIDLASITDFYNGIISDGHPDFPDDWIADMCLSNEERDVNVYTVLQPFWNHWRGDYDPTIHGLYPLDYDWENPPNPLPYWTEDMVNFVFNNWTLPLHASGYPLTDPEKVLFNFNPNHDKTFDDIFYKAYEHISVRYLWLWQIDDIDGDVLDFMYANRANLIGLFNVGDIDNFIYFIYTFMATLMEMLYEQQLKIQELHQSLQADKYAWYTDDNGDEQPSISSLGWHIVRIARALGIHYETNGELQSVRQRKNIPYKKDANGNSVVTVPEGWERGQFATNTGDKEKAHDPTDHDRQNGGLELDEDDRLGIAYQQRCNKYSKFNATNPEESVIEKGDVVLCENIPQLLESFWEDLDKAINMREMGTGVMPSADNSQYCSFEGLGTLVAENAYMLSSLSGNIYQTHNLAIMTNHLCLQILKALGIPVANEMLKFHTGECDEFKQEIIAKMPVPVVAQDAMNITQQNFAILRNLSLIIGAMSPPATEDTSGSGTSTPTTPATP